MRVVRRSPFSVTSQPWRKVVPAVRRKDAKPWRASEHARARHRFIDPPGYVRHRPEATLLYEVVERHYLELVAAREAAGRGWWARGFEREQRAVLRAARPDACIGRVSALNPVTTGS
jgi:hypothetical protein